ncbi:protein dj-1beta [Bacillus rossius redtenbacheri]|uniref:protein dj-1beta n=1 Tax=Bacillus rossius redtenbacheri TaxID=93214 RepID=UPI002FDE3884
MRIFSLCKVARFLERSNRFNINCAKYCFASSTMSKSALVLLAEGAEEMEFVVSVDILRRAGITTTVAGLNNTNPVICSRNVGIVPDMGFNDAVKKGPYDVVVLPGGLQGAKNLSASKEVKDLLKDQENSGRLIAAICAAPTVLKTHGIAKGKQITSYPSFEDDLVAGGYKYSEDDVVVDGKLITSRGPGTAFKFALRVAEQLVGEEVVERVAKGLLL